ncbi:MAG: glycine--tRNA ligase subunit beta [Thermoanaerobaculia bacterium]
MAGSEFLLEVRSEEIPARLLQPAIQELATRLFAELMELNLAPAEMETGFTPRRLILMLKGLPSREADREEELVGPPVRAAFDTEGLPTRAAEGFARKCGVEVEALQRVETDKGEYLAASRKVVGRAVSEVLAQMVPPLVEGLSWAKTMRWGVGEGPWVRPIHGVVALCDGEVVPCRVFDVESGSETSGHPVLSPRPFAIRGVSDYRRKMARRQIVVRFEERRQRIQDQLEAAAQSLGSELVEDQDLLDRLTAICEIPGTVVGRFEPAFLSLPREVLITSLRDHQSAFTLESGGMLLPSFITVMDRPDDPKGRVRAGNEWVVAARLEDARFFFNEDGKTSLEQRQEKLQHLTFHAKLGSYAAKTERIAELTKEICDSQGWNELVEEASTASNLLKVDLTSEMVKEFTSLQGIVGGLYAEREQYPAEVWQAIYDQYLPASTEDAIPRGRVGQATALADRIDTLVGMFGLGLIPSGSRDPFGLRRAGQGVVRIVLESEMPLDLDLIAAKSVLLFGDLLDRSGKEILSDLRFFLQDRVRHLLGLRGYAYDTIESALAAGSSNLPDLLARVDAVHKVREESDFLSVVLAAKRIANILREAPDEDLVEARLKEPAERDLHGAANNLRKNIDRGEKQADYEQCLRAIAKLSEPLDRFFVEVLVMDENRELRNNRIALLQAIQRMISRTARLTEVVVDKSEHRDRGESKSSD